MSERTVAGARWSCQGTGFCCRFHQLGPVSAVEVKSIEATDPAGWWPPAREGWLLSRSGPTGLAHELRKVDGHCVFLDPDNRCALHARHGPKSKPGFCQLYPYQVVEDAQGLAIIVRDSCAGRWSAIERGEPMEEQAGQAVDLARAHGGVLRWAPTEVSLLPGRSVALDDWMRVEGELLDALAEPSLAAEALVPLLRRRLAERFGLDLPAPLPDRARLAGRAVLLALDMTLARARHQETAPSQEEADFAAELHRRVGMAAVELESGHGLSGPEGWDLYARTCLAEGLLGKDLHRLDGLFAGLGLTLITLHIARASASPGTDAELARAHARVARFTQNRSIREVLRAAAPALRDLALHAPA